MSLFQRPIRPPAILSDEAVERYLLVLRAEVSPDPLFRRRLRGAVVNRFVANREGRVGRSSRARHMGALGRTVLYASFVLSISVSSAMAASQGAAPGDALYPVKIQIERLRLEALPEHLHDDLAAHSLGERIHELGLLAERGDWGRMPSHAAMVEAEYLAYVASVAGDGDNASSAARHIVVFGALLERLPDRAQLQIPGVVSGVASARDKVGGRQDGGSSSAGGSDHGGPSSGAGSAGGSSQGGRSSSGNGAEVGSGPSGGSPSEDTGDEGGAPREPTDQEASPTRTPTKSPKAAASPRPSNAPDGPGTAPAPTEHPSADD